MQHDPSWLPPWSVLSQHTTSTRSLWDFPLKARVESAARFCLQYLSPPLQQFLLTNKLVIIPMSAIMLISLCSILHQRFPRFFAILNGAKRPLSGTVTTVCSLLYAVDIGLHLNHSLWETEEDLVMQQSYKYTPSALILDPFFPVHLCVSLFGLAVGLHTLQILREKGPTVTFVLELAGGYISIFGFVLTSHLSKTDDMGSLKNICLCLSIVVSCVTLQAIGLSCGISLFHQLGILSARCITGLKHCLYFFLKISHQLFLKCRLYFTHICGALSSHVSAFVTRVRSGDRMSRFIKTYFLYPLIPLQQTIHQSAIQACQNLHIILSLSLYYLKIGLKSGGQCLRTLWTCGVYGAFQYGQIITDDILLPFVYFIYSELILIGHALFNACTAVVQFGYYLCFNLLCEGLLFPCGTFMFRAAWKVARICCQIVEHLIQSVYTLCIFFCRNLILYPVSFLYRQLLALGSVMWTALCQTCVWVLDNVWRPFSAAGRSGCVWVWNHFLLALSHSATFFSRMCVHIWHNAVVPFSAYLWVTVIQIGKLLTSRVLNPLHTLSRNLGSFLWKYLFSLLLIGFGIKFLVNVIRGVFVTSQPSILFLDACGLVLGGYVCLIAGLLLICSKCPPFYKQRETITLLTNCYRTLDFCFLRCINFFFSLLTRISSSAFRSISKLVSVLWKAAFDIVDFLCTLVIQATRSLTQGLYSHFLKPVWKALVKSIFLVWNSPFISFGASFTVLGATLFCHVHEINPYLLLIKNWHYCVQVISITKQWLTCALNFHQDDETGMIVRGMFRATLSMCTQITGVHLPAENLWLTAANQSLWQLSEIPSLGWTLYVVHLCGSIVTRSLDADPKVFVRGIMKVIYYPLIAAYVLSGVPIMPCKGTFQVMNIISFGKVYALYTLAGAIILLIEMRRLRAVPDVQVWRRQRARGGADALSAQHRSAVPPPSAPSLPLASSANRTVKDGDGLPAEIPFEYLIKLPPPSVTFDSPECPICLDELSPHTHKHLDTTSGSKINPSHVGQLARVLTIDAPPLAAAGEDDHNCHQASLCLPCGHIFHQDCITEWLQEQGLCPSCREAVPPTAAEWALLSTTTASSLIQDVFM